MTDFDYSDLTKLAADLGTVPAKSGPNIRKAFEVTSVNVKKAWQEPLKGSASLAGLPSALGYDIETDGTSIKSEIGFDKNRSQGPLGNISEFGSPTIAPRGFGLTALEANQADFQKGLEIAISDALKEAGL